MKIQLEKLKDFDAYYKPIEDYHERTFIGGTVSILCWLTIFFLTSLRCYEFWSYKEIQQSIFVDSSRNPKLWINLDVVVPGISCDYVALDAMDSSGEEHLQIEHNVFKRRLDSDGKPLEDPKKEEIGSKSVAKTEPPSSTEALPKCGSCYGAEDSNNLETLNITCCNTCDEVKDAYRRRRWHIQETKFDQCKSSATAKQIQRAFEEGCQVYGYMEVNRVSGSFHIAPGQSFSMNHVHVHDVQPFSSSQFNTSHIIRHLSFGKSKITDSIDMPTNPLDGTISMAHEGATMFNYYIKIVPTMIVGENGATFHTNQFSVTKHEKIVSPASGESGMPGIFFSYELSSMMVKLVTKSVPLAHLITDLCSIVGGVWIFSMFIDSVFYRSSKLLNKMELGKAS